jgi:2-dehydropantoate 2-reductase
MKIAVFGAGSIGAYVGGSLLAAGGDVMLIGRARMRSRTSLEGLKLTDLYGRRVELPSVSIRYAEHPRAMSDAGLILVTVKSADTPVAAAAILEHAPADAVVLSLQNGIGNADVLRAALPGRCVLAGMVPFNVAPTPDGRLHRATSGEIMVEKTPALEPWHKLFVRANLPLHQRDNFGAVQWGKLLINLNNSVNALSGLPIKAQLSQRDYRRCFAAMISETLVILRSAGVRPAKVAKVGPAMMALVLRLPDPLFRRVAAAMLRIDPEARSSMWDDLQAGRRTEVDYINGAVLLLAASMGLDAPLNRRMVALIREAEAGRSPARDGAGLYRELCSSTLDSVTVSSPSSPDRASVQ